jgi:hypothetical protein
MKKKEEDKEKNVETWMKENEEVGRRRKYIKRANERHYQGWRTMKDKKKSKLKENRKEYKIDRKCTIIEVCLMEDEKFTYAEEVKNGVSNMMNEKR